ncbi:MAG TPA: dihydroorotase [Alcanivorax sp.]|jgi:dihydroorotase|uniref:dihydroorotase n=1 Tax=Alloalcanivorax venustensis TaxID=172371 RepID=UPI000E899A9F|nr:dihydroorotase [Alcanivorax sp.]MCH9784310.1 dihydroorotase [Gammaproteobacteria bacterium]MEA3261516.1 dihydroorotase [Pseudomonadota bacterium]HBM24815.1 dihydroorotase [Alcanivorax sp.]HCJ63612.1 dihydroorotase [Alcanivorax sp.]|tara:strand:+ start:2661 stop:3704 length:1044 start_codon:yes stop_codon:yes gene_type:complete
MTDTLTLTRPDDWHLHFRDGAMLEETVPATARVFRRAIVMPNLTPPVTTVALAEAYRERILAAIPAGVDFEPLMVLYLTDETPVEEIERAAQSPFVHAFKLYPAGATTNSDSGVTNPARIHHLYEALEKHDLPFLVHGEVTEPEIDIFDRERVFIDRYLNDIRERFPALRIVFEHVTTSEGVDFVREGGDLTAATVTPQHLLMNRNDLLVGGVRPHNYCLPVLKRRTHQQAIQQAVLEGHPRFFLGTDSAPHARDKKEAACGCAGCYSARAALPLYASFLDRHGALDKLEGFASHFGADFYRLPRNPDTVTLERRDWAVPETVTAAGEDMVPFMAGQALPWAIRESQ